MAPEEAMRRALELAARGLGRTSPNPAVGAVVMAGDELVAEAYHARAGELHAERLALLAAGDRARGATVYCTLEPCCTQGRTPPCTDLIIRSGVSEVWYASTDPDPRCQGRGAEVLRQAGITVHAGLLQAEADLLNEAYFRHKATGLPLVTLKLASSLDGRVATAGGQSRWITGPESRAMVHRLRDQADAVLVGIGTVLADDPQLTVRTEVPEARDPRRVIADTLARTPPDARVITGGGAPCLIAVGETAPEDRVAAMRRAGAEVLRLPETAGHLDLAALLQALGQRDLMSVLCEGGPKLAAALIAADLVSKYLLFYGPLLIGGDGLPMVSGPSAMELPAAPRLTISAHQMVGSDLLVTAYPCSQA